MLTPAGLFFLCWIIVFTFDHLFYTFTCVNASKRVKHFVGRTLLMKSQRFKFEVFSLVLIRSAFPESWSRARPARRVHGAILRACVCIPASAGKKLSKAAKEHRNSLKRRKAGGCGRAETKGFTVYTGAPIPKLPCVNLIIVLFWLGIV